MLHSPGGGGAVINLSQAMSIQTPSTTTLAASTAATTTATQQIPLQLQQTQPNVIRFSNLQQVSDADGIGMVLLTLVDILVSARLRATFD